MNSLYSNKNLVLTLCVCMVVLFGCKSPTGSSTPPNFVAKFSGTNSFINISSSSSLKPQAVTIEMWVYVDTLHSVFIPLLSTTGENQASTAEGYSLKFERDWIYLRIASPRIAADPIGIGIRATYTPPAKQWVHIAGSYNDTSSIVYINGLEAVKKDSAFAISYGTNGLTLGYGFHSTFGGSSFFHGMLDEIRIWDYARTQQEIQQAMKIRLTGNEDGLVGYWNFDSDESGVQATDASNYENHGTLSDSVSIVANGPF